MEDVTNDTCASDEDAFQLLCGPEEYSARKMAECMRSPVCAQHQLLLGLIATLFALQFIFCAITFFVYKKSLNAKRQASIGPSTSGASLRPTQRLLVARKRRSNDKARPSNGKVLYYIYTLEKVGALVVVSGPLFAGFGQLPGSIESTITIIFLLLAFSGGTTTTLLSVLSSGKSKKIVNAIQTNFSMEKGERARAKEAKMKIAAQVVPHALYLVVFFVVTHGPMPTVPHVLQLACSCIGLAILLSVLPAAYYNMKLAIEINRITPQSNEDVENKRKTTSKLKMDS